MGYFDVLYWIICWFVIWWLFCFGVYACVWCVSFYVLDLCFLGLINLFMVVLFWCCLEFVCLLCLVGFRWLCACMRLNLLLNTWGCFVGLFLDCWKCIITLCFGVDCRVNFVSCNCVFVLLLINWIAFNLLCGSSLLCCVTRVDLDFNFWFAGALLCWFCFAAGTLIVCVWCLGFSVLFWCLWFNIIGCGLFLVCFGWFWIVWVYWWLVSWCFIVVLVLTY